MILTALAWAGVATVTPGEADTALAPRRVAVVIGIQEYDDPALAGLRFATKDALDFGAVLGSADGGGFDRVFAVHGAAATTRSAIENAIRVATADLGRDDTFLLYVSGHGTLTLDPIEGSRLWLLPSDASLDAPEEHGLAVATLEEMVNNLPARRRVLILDTCHNGRAGSKSSLGTATAQLLQGLRGEVPAPRVDRDIAESEARLYAAQYHQPAMEDPALQNGVYTHFLLAGLTNARDTADLDRDGLVDVAEAHQYARDHTISYTGGLQVPRAEYRIVGREDIYLSGPADTRSLAERALVSAYDRALDRARILINGIPRGELPGLVAVDPGVSQVEVQMADGRTVLDERVHLRPGDTLPLETLLDDRDSAIEVLGGVAYSAGVGARHPLAASLSVGWVRPYSLTGRHIRPDLQVGITAATGTLAANAGRPTPTGELWAGGTFAWDAGVLYAGPTANLRLPWRVDGPTGTAQLGLGGGGGAAVGFEIPAARDLTVDLRLDAWAGTEQYAGSWIATGGGGLRLGVMR